VEELSICASVPCGYKTLVAELLNNPVPIRVCFNSFDGWWCFVVCTRAAFGTYGLIVPPDLRSSWVMLRRITGLAFELLDSIFIRDFVERFRLGS
jgi:hypothetical protein